MPHVQIAAARDRQIWAIYVVHCCLDLLHEFRRDFHDPVSPYGVARGSTASVIVRSRRPTISSVTPSLGSDWTLSLRARQGFQA
jgi:hypothetical protein